MGTSDITIGTRETYGRERQPFGISRQDLRQHLVVVGKSGVGKSTLLENMAMQECLTGRGFAFLDPHGDSIQQILRRIPRSRIEDVVLFDPSDAEFPVAFNVFDRVPRERRHLVASGLVEAFKGIWRDSWGPRLEYILYAAFAAVLECENVSLLSVQRMLSDARYRKWVVRQVKDPIVRAFWETEFEEYDKRLMAEAVAPIQNKIGQVLMSPPLRNILGQVKGRIGARFMMDRKKIFLADLSKGKLGADKSALLGALLMSQFYSAAMSRADVPREERADYTVFADEFHSFVSTSVSSMLSEARKFGLSVVLATQTLGTLDRGVRDAVLGNVGSIVSFRVGPGDADVLERACGGNVKAGEFTSLDNGMVVAKLLRGGREALPFVGLTLPPTAAPTDRSGPIIRRCRERYARPREEVEAKIANWRKPKRREKTADPVRDRRRTSYAKRRIELPPRKGPAERGAVK